MPLSVLTGPCVCLFSTLNFHYLFETNLMNTFHNILFLWNYFQHLYICSFTSHMMFKKSATAKLMIFIVKMCLHAPTTHILWPGYSFIYFMTAVVLLCFYWKILHFYMKTRWMWIKAAKHMILNQLSLSHIHAICYHLTATANTAGIDHLHTHFKRYFYLQSQHFVENVSIST